MSIPAFNEIIEQNDQTEARRASLEAIAHLVGNVSEQIARVQVSGVEDTITASKHFDMPASKRRWLRSRRALPKASVRLLKRKMRSTKN
ncbi:MAG: hypothetical protein IPG67_08080 [Acidobacteria bacterium]|nr:hypothetical protein [Acidobacteriota bacterium]